ncbi:MAG: S9 family peptidase [Myxococcota bacterium]|nr:S9 family peptidase [Myxococcota bacterium]
MCRDEDGRIGDVLPAGVDARSRVHEYGGGDYLASPRGLFTIENGTPGIQLRALRNGGEADRVPGSDTGARYAEPVLSPDGRTLAAVEEWAQAEGEPVNRLVSFDLAGGGRRVLAEGHDFYASACFSPDGGSLAFLCWDHPHLPWDAATLFELPIGAGGAPRHVAGGPHESIFQPTWSPGGVLTFASDRSGFWNLHQWRGGDVVSLCERAAEFGLPQWVFGMRRFGFVSEERIACVVSEEGRDRLALLDLGTGALDDVASSASAIDGIDVSGHEIAVIAANERSAPSVQVLDLDSGRFETVREAFEVGMDPEALSPAESVRFASTDGRPVHAFLYRPRLPGVEAPAGERPPLLVKVHGGPTAATSSALDLATQFWTTRGFAVLDVNYTGSTGFGRAYRDGLKGAWGVADVEDCAAGARFAASEGGADPARLGIRGGSAGGYTVLCALTLGDVFGFGASHYGIGDLEALARDTHKFEARYLDGLVAPWPEGEAVYRERSPLYHVEGLSCPVIFLQGSEDRVVPPAQAESMVAALAARGLPHAYVLFEGEGHGFRRAENIRAALQAELFFYGRVLGFPTAATPPVAMQGRIPAGPPSEA